MNSWIRRAPLFYDYQALSHQGIRTLKPYIPGKSCEALAKEKKLKEIVKLASNENPLGCSEKVKDALAHMSIGQLSSYPDPHNHLLHQKLCDSLGIERSMLILENGSDALFTLALFAFALHTGKKALIHQHAFMGYRIQAQVLGVPVVCAPVYPDWRVDIAALIEASQDDIGILFLANPNNPTGLILGYAEIEKILQGIPASTILVLDEAYYEYANLGNTNSVDLLKTYSNLIVTRTFSKAYGLAGLRLGYGIAHPSIINILSKIHLPFTVNQAALEAGCAALEDKNFIQETRMSNQLGMNELEKGFHKLRLNFLPSRGNFICFDCQEDALKIYNRLLDYGIIVRPLDTYALPNHLRVTVGKPIQNYEFLDKLALILNQTRENR